MSKQKIETEVSEKVIAEKKYKGSQLLKDNRFNNRVGRIVIKPDKNYSIEEAKSLVDEFLRKR